MSQRNNYAETNVNKIIMLKQMQIKYFSRTFLKKTSLGIVLLKNWPLNPKKNNMEDVIGVLIISEGHLYSDMSNSVLLYSRMFDACA